jgi:hypothetical protein
MKEKMLRVSTISDDMDDIIEKEDDFYSDTSDDIDVNEVVAF